MSQGMLQATSPSVLIKQILQRPEFADVNTPPPPPSLWETYLEHFWATINDWLHKHSPQDTGTQEHVSQILVGLIVCVGIFGFIVVSRHLYLRIRPRNLITPPPGLPVARAKTIAGADALAQTGAFPEAIAELFELAVDSCITKKILQPTPSATPYEYANALPKEGPIYAGFSVVAPLVVLAVYARETLTLEDWQLARSATQAVLESPK